MPLGFRFYSPVAFESWDHRTPDETGIGGSETAVVELAARLAARGHDVAVYAPVRPDCPTRDRGGARWLPLDAADFDESAVDVWVCSRCPAVIDQLPRRPGRQAWLVCQDVDYPNPESGLNADRAAGFDRILSLCPTHQRYLRERYPGAAVGLSTNGIKVESIRAREATRPVTRDPYRVVWTGSPDRGLLRAAEIVRRAREFEPRLTLTATYGLDNIRKCEGPAWRRIERRVEALAAEPWVTLTGRLAQPELHDVVRSAGLWVYCTDFAETSCICSMEAQALGAVPVFSPTWALNDNVGHGVAIEGAPDDPLTRARFASAVLTLARDPGLAESVRAEMMPWARERFDWERVADDYEMMAGVAS